MKKTAKIKLADYWMEQFKKYGVPSPYSYTEKELIDLNPTVPVDFIRNHVKKRDKKFKD